MKHSFFWRCVIFSLVGCSPAVTKPPTSPKLEHQHADRTVHVHTPFHEEEHGVPPHKPHSFAEAITEIDRRGRALQGSSHRPPTQVTEWFDILNWLPELAADTDLKSADWDHAVRIGRDLEDWSSSWKSSEAENKTVDIAPLESLVGELRQLLSISKTYP